MPDFLLTPFTTQLPAPLLWLSLGWLFAVGACIGSFMNVVIYRLPAGQSLLYPPSRCPRCERPIRARDNVPIFGWLWLGGRCRHCRAAISPRYPAVELLVAVLFVALACVEPLPSGEDAAAISDGARSLSQWWGLYAYHLFLLCSLCCAAFIEFDGHRLPRSMAAAGFFVGLVAPFFWPHLRPAAASTALPAWPAAIADGLIGIAAGAAAEFVGGLWCAKGDTRGGAAYASATAVGWVGTFLGWHAALVLAAAAVAASLILTAARRAWPAVGRVGLIGCLAPWLLPWIAGFGHRLT